MNDRAASGCSPTNASCRGPVRAELLAPHGLLFGLGSVAGRDVSSPFGYGLLGLLAAFCRCAVGIGYLLTARRVGIFVHTGGSSMAALARGTQLAEVQASARIVNQLLLETEQSRGR